MNKRLTFGCEDVLDLVWEFLVSAFANIVISEVMESLENLLILSDKFDVEGGLVVDQLEFSSDEQELHSIEQEDESEWTNNFEETIDNISDFELFSSP